MYWYKRLTSRSPFHLAQINNLRQKLNLNSVGMNNSLYRKLPGLVLTWKIAKKGNEKHSTAYRGDNQ